MITKETIIEKIEIKKDGTVKVREKTIFMEDGVKVGEDAQKKIIYPGQSFDKEKSYVKNIISAAQTPDVVQKFKYKQLTDSMGTTTIEKEGAKK